MSDALTCLLFNPCFLVEKPVSWPRVGYDMFLSVSRCVVMSEICQELWRNHCAQSASTCRVRLLEQRKLWFHGLAEAFSL